MSDYSLYLHIPFCIHRCSYCDFNTYAGLESLIPDYVRALCREIEVVAASSGARLPVHTVFFGGGTPSLLPVPQLERILAALHERFDLSRDLEMTLEANPGTLSPDYLHALRSLGVNRLSLGMQSANPQELRLLERQHGVVDVIQAVKWARQAGFENLNLDLIFGLPYQALDAWQRTLDFALRLHPEHFSLYALTLEHGTPMQHWAQRGLLSQPDPDQAAEMYEWAAERLEAHGYLQYEISNWGLGVEGQPLACRHNLQYWRDLPYLGFGAGAHGYANGSRTANVLSPRVYLRRLLDDSPQPTSGDLAFPRSPAAVDVQAIDQVTEMGERMMMGLRLTREGVSASAFQDRFGSSLAEVYPREIQDLLRVGLLEWAGEGHEILRLTPRGRLLGNQVFMRFI